MGRAEAKNNGMHTRHELLIQDIHMSLLTRLSLQSSPSLASSKRDRAPSLLQQSGQLGFSAEPGGIGHRWIAFCCETVGPPLQYWFAHPHT